MDSKVNYTLVGLFVVLLFVGLITFAYWLGKHGGKQEYEYYHVYMTESVAGLSIDASVKYRGVEIGTVEDIGLNPKNSEEVELLLKIKRKTPVKMDTSAALKSFGLTGLAYVELEGGNQDAPLLAATDAGIPVIPARPSAFARFDESMSQLSQKSALALDKFDRLLSEENLRNVTAILAETRILAKDIRVQAQGFQNVVDSGVVMGKRITNAFEKVEAASVSIKKVADSLEKNSAEVGRNMSQDVRQSLESFNQLLYELDILAGDLQRTIQNIEDSPSDLLFKRSQPQPGPGEEGYNEE
jgi:phospholipid/cholesterol/gamma-HCH transport system substrate-binding protein